MAKGQNLIGKTFGNLTVVDLSERVKFRSGTQRKWKCICKCGKETKVSTGALNGGHTRSCGCAKREKTLDLSGRKFGKLTAISLHDYKREKNGATCSRWLVRCECGKEKVIRSNHLLSRKVASCGSFECKTYKVKYLDRRIPEINKRIASIKYSAKKRILSFELSDGMIFELLSSNCNYCGRSPVFIGSRFVPHGVDRVNNNLGYVDGNVVSSCGECNVAKGERSSFEFYDWVEMVYNNKNKVVINRDGNLIRPSVWAVQ